MEQLEKIERNRKLPLRPQEVESMCSNMDGFQRDGPISSYYSKKNKIVTLQVQCTMTRELSHFVQTSI